MSGGQGLSQPDPGSMFCLVRDPFDQHWLRFDQPLALLTASNAAELNVLLSNIESAADEGLKAAGFITYEASEAFDAGLSVHLSNSPIAVFGLFDQWDVLETLPVMQPSIVDVQPQISPANYMGSVEAIKRWLEEGESYQVNFTHP